MFRRGTDIHSATQDIYSILFVLWQYIERDYKMKNKSFSIPIGMVIKKFYCHKCGERLTKRANTRTVKPGESDYKKYNKISRRTYMIGDVEVTEYDFQCPSCGNIIGYDEQCLVRKIQKRLRKNILSKDEILAIDHWEK